MLPLQMPPAIFCQRPSSRSCTFSGRRQQQNAGFLSRLKRPFLWQWPNVIFFSFSVVIKYFLCDWGLSDMERYPNKPVQSLLILGKRPWTLRIYICATATKPMVVSDCSQKQRSRWEKPENVFYATWRITFAISWDPEKRFVKVP